MAECQNPDHDHSHDGEPDPSIPAPGPLQTHYAWQMVNNSAGVRQVVLTAITPQGTTYLFMDPASAVQIGNGLRQLGKEGLGPAPGLVVPNGAGSGLVVPR